MSIWIKLGKQIIVYSSFIVFIALIIIAYPLNYWLPFFCSRYQVFIGVLFSRVQNRDRTFTCFDINKLLLFIINIINTQGLSLDNKLQIKGGGKWEKYFTLGQFYGGSWITDQNYYNKHEFYKIYR
jgi:hypothetical protein